MGITSFLMLGLTIKTIIKFDILEIKESRCTRAPSNDVVGTIKNLADGYVIFLEITWAGIVAVVEQQQEFPALDS
jgi:hypothetical protein